jgi:hypothetical protein
MNHILRSPMKAPATLPSLLEQLEQQAPEQTRSAEEVAPHVKANRIADPTLAEIVPPGTDAADLELGQPVFHSTFGYGEVAAIDGNAVTFRERKDLAVTHTVAVEDLITRIQAEVGLKTCYFAGGAKAWRRAQGKWASLTKNLCKQGEWGEVLKKYDLNRSSMDDLIRRFEEEATWEAQDAALAAKLPESGNLNPTAPVESCQPSVYAVTGSPHVNERTPDPENDARQKNIQVETVKREGIQLTHHRTTLFLQRRNLDPKTVALYHKIEGTDKKRVAGIRDSKIDELIAEVVALAAAVLPDDSIATTTASVIATTAPLVTEATPPNVTTEDTEIEEEVRAALRNDGVKVAVIRKIQFDSVRGLPFREQYRFALKQANGRSV